MTAAPDRLRGILASYQLRFPKESEPELLARIDARIVPLFLQHDEHLPTTKTQLNGFVKLVDAVDKRMSELGYSEFATNERLGKAKDYFASDSTTVEDATPHLATFQQLREELWKSAKK